MQLLFKFCLADFCPVEIPLYDGHPVRRVLRGPIGRYQHLSSTVSNGQDVRYTRCSFSLTSVFPYDGHPVRRDFTLRWIFSLSSVARTYRALPASVECCKQRTGCPLYGLQLFVDVSLSVRRTSCPLRFHRTMDIQFLSYPLLLIGNTAFPTIREGIV